MRVVLQPCNPFNCEEMLHVHRGKLPSEAVGLSAEEAVSIVLVVTTAGHGWCKLPLKTTGQDLIFEWTKLR